VNEPLILERFCDSQKHGTFGIISYKGEQIAVTVEKPWSDNKPFESCIPQGKYKLVTFIRGNGDHVFALINKEIGVYKTQADMMASGGKGRYSILIHVANYADDVVGCIGPGEEWTWDSRKEILMVTKSGKTTAKLLSLIRKNNITDIEIFWKEHW